MVCTLEVSATSNNKCCLFILFPLGNIFVRNLVKWYKDYKCVSVCVCIKIYRDLTPGRNMNTPLKANSCLVAEPVVRGSLLRRQRIMLS